MDFARFHNQFSPREGDFLVRALNVRSFSQAEVCRRCEDRHEGFTASQMEAAIRLLTAELARIVSEGSGARLDFVTITPGVRGVISAGTGVREVAAAVNTSAGGALLKAVQECPLNEVPAGKAGPVILAVGDTASGAGSSAAAPDGILIVTGRNLKVAGEGSGVFFRAADGTETPAALPLAENLPRRLLFKVPASLTPGAYRLLVRTRWFGGKPVKELRTGECPLDLAIPPPTRRT